MKSTHECEGLDVPEELKSIDRWCNYKLVYRKDSNKPAKIPYGRVRTVSWKEVSNLTSFSAAVHRDAEHLGFVLGGSGFIGIDVDDAYDNHGMLKPVVDELICLLPSTWGDRSPSGKGLHLWLKGRKPDGMPCKFSIPEDVVVEVYDADRFFTVTGVPIPEAPITIADENSCLVGLWQWLNGGEEPVVASSRKSRFRRTASERSLLENWQKQVENRENLRQLWVLGDTSRYRGDWSSADLALCNHLAFWMQGDEKLVDKMFRRSALMRDKWDEKRGARTYGELTIAEAISGLIDVYDPSRSALEKTVTRLAKEYVWIKRLDRFINLHDPTHELSRMAVRSSHLYEIKAADIAILKHKNRQEVLGLGFFPGQPRIVTVGRDKFLNQWSPAEIEPVEGDVSPFIEAMQHTYPDEQAREVMIWFMAFTVARPALKIRWAPVIIGAIEGSGKSFWFDVALRQLVGPQHFRPVSESDLFGSFNEYLAHSKLVAIEEIWAPGRDGGKLINRLKPVITNDSIAINRKFLSTYTITNFVSCVFFSNHSDALAIGAHDRRFFVYETPAVAMESVRKGWGKELAYWLSAKEGLPHLLWYFQNEVDLEAYQPGGHAPETPDKERLKQLASPSLVVWLGEALEQDRNLGTVVIEKTCFLTFNTVSTAWKEQSGRLPTQGMLNDAFQRLGWRYFERFKADSGGKWSPSGWASPGLARMLDRMTKRQQSKLILSLVHPKPDF